MGCSLLVVKAALNFSSRYPVRNIGVIYISDPFTSAGYCFGDFFAARTTVTFCSYGYLVNALPHAVATHSAPSPPQIQRSDCILQVLSIMIMSKYLIGNQKAMGGMGEAITLVFPHGTMSKFILSQDGRARLVCDRLLRIGEFLEHRRRNLFGALLTAFLSGWSAPFPNSHRWTGITMLWTIRRRK